MSPPILVRAVQAASFAARCVVLSAMTAPALLATPMAHVSPQQGQPFGFEEAFALATERGDVLDQLIPGTRDDYFYRCLHLQNTGAFDQVAPLLSLWEKRHGKDSRFEEIENRQALLTYDRDPQTSLEFLRERLGLVFAHRREVAGATPDLPTRLEATLISRATLTRRAFDKHGRSLSGFTDSALDFLVASNLDDDRLLSLMQRLQRPDHPNLPALIVRNLGHPQSRGFGSLPIHGMLMLEQLDECARLRPSLLNESAFVDAFVRRLQPSTDLDWRNDAVALEAYFERLDAFVARLSTAFNSLRAHVLYHRLVHDRARGVHDRQRFMDYLRLPRVAPYVNQKHLERRSGKDALVSFGQDHPTGLGPIGNDEALVRACFMHFFRDEASYVPYAELIRDDYLRRVFAETKILFGLGDMERWYSLLDDPAYYEALKERVEIEFAPTQPTRIGADDPVSIDVDLKNVGTLLVKVFEINAFNVYSESGARVGASINLDGLIANEEQTYSYDDNALRRVRRTFEFPSLERPGAYVIEFIGNGMSSRAVVHKGRLQFTERVGAAGHVFTVRDEQGRPLDDATIWLKGRQFTADEHGEVVIPFTTEQGTQMILLRHGELTTQAHFTHLAERYELHAAIFLDRESLLTRRTAKLLVRPTMFVNDRPASLRLLEHPVLTITSSDHDGVATTLEVRDFELFADRESVHEIQVPDRLASLTVSLAGVVQNLSTGKPTPLTTASQEFRVNLIDTTAQTSTTLLGRTEQGYVLDLLGKNGEPRADRALTVTLRHHDFTDEVTVALKTDAAGRVQLGELTGIDSLKVVERMSKSGWWDLSTEARTYPSRLTGVTGETLRVPYQGRESRINRRVASLIERRGGANAHDRFPHLALDGGFLELRDLQAGDYTLWLKEADEQIEVLITSGDIQGDWIVGRDRMLPVAPQAPLHITDVAASNDTLTIRLANAGSDTRVHVITTRYLPPFDPFVLLLAPEGRRASIRSIDHPDSTYASGREIGDEYRYILERRYTTRFPGNMLRRPALLLNPWAVDETETLMGVSGAAAGKLGGRQVVGGGGGGTAGFGFLPSHGSQPGLFPNLDFLPQPSAVLVNLRPDEDGVLTVPRADLGPGQLVHVLALDSEHTVSTTHALPETTLEPTDLRLRRSLDPAGHFTEQRRIDFLDTGNSTTVEDITTASIEVIDSLTSVHRLFTTLSGNTDLGEFAFLLRWPDIEHDERLELYSKYACHELHMFLHEKDPAFFDQLVRPYLANKMHKTFLDHWLLDAELSAYLEPWAFARLNVAERILLSRRIAERDDAEPAATTRHLRELLDLVPPDPDRSRRLFETALKGSALDTNVALAETMSAAVLEQLEALGYLGARKAPPTNPSGTAAAGPGRSHGGNYRPPGRGRSPRDQDDFLRREDLRMFYRGPDRTREYAEHNYWHRRIAEQDQNLIQPNEFWHDYAVSRGTKPFVSSHLAEAAGSFAEMMLALAVLDLPFEAAEHESEFDGGRLALSAQSPLLLVRKEIKPAKATAAASPILISESFYRLDDRYAFEGNQRVDKPVSEEFLIDVVYGAQVVLTNPSSSARRLELLVQIPRGAIPVQGGLQTRGVDMQLGPFSTTTSDYHFYFPQPGEFAHYPAHVSQGEELVAFADPMTMHVVAEPSTVDTTSWEHVSQNGSFEDVTAFLDTANLQRLDLFRIAWRMQERDVFEQTLARLRARHVFDSTLWSYGLLHDDAAAIREYLPTASGFVAHCGGFLDSPLLSIDPVERRDYQHIEYEPLFNGRAHRFGRDNAILNSSLANQYAQLLRILAYRPRLDDVDWMTVTYYLLLQDRVEEALGTFARVDPDRLPMRVQYDYARAYMDFFSEDHALARGIAEAYRDHPVERWRVRFADVLNQLDEAEGAEVATSDSQDRNQQQTALAASEPSLELEVEARRVTLRHQNLSEVEVSYYKMDIEFLFSTSPFVQQGSGAFAFIRPNRRDIVALSSDERVSSFDLPAEFHASNVLVEVRAGGLVRRQAYYANTLSVQVIETYGHLKVTHAESAAPLPRVYVKVFARTSGGGTRFHKDGYTDLRGRFDYASLSGEDGDPAERYAILVLSEADGAVIREVAAPAR